MSTETETLPVEPAALAPEAPRVEIPELDVSELSSASSDVMLRSLAKNCVALKVSVSAIGYERLVQNAQVSVGEHEIAPEFLAGARFKVVPNNIKNPLGRIAGHARQVPYSYGTPFIGGAYLIPIAKDRAVQAVRDLDSLASPTLGLTDEAAEQSTDIKLQKRQVEPLCHGLGADGLAGAGNANQNNTLRY